MIKNPKGKLIFEFNDVIDIIDTLSHSQGFYGRLLRDIYELKRLIENTLSSFALSLLYPFGINLIPGIFRIPSLKNYSGCSKCMYFFSKLVALI